MNLVNPHGRGGAELDFSNHTVPDRLGVFDVSVRTADIELLAVVDAKKEIVFSWGGGRKIEFMGGAKRVLLANFFSVQPESAFPDHPFQKEGDAFLFPLFRNFDGPAVPGGPDIGKLAGEPGETGLTDFRFGPARGTESGLIRCSWKGDRIFERSLWVEPVLTEAQAFGIESDLPGAGEGLGFLGVRATGKNESKKETKTVNPDFHHKRSTLKISS